jgi:mono/diheme cytochrome c family protein
MHCNSITYKQKIQHWFLNILVFSLLTTFTVHNAVAQTAEEKGEKIFKGNCASCHAIDKKVVGPALKDVFSRVPQPAEDWLKKWIKNSSAVIKSGDAYANKIFAEYNKSVMPAQAISDDELKDLLAYIKNPPAPKQAPAAAASAQGDTNTSSGSNEMIIYVLGVLFIILIIVFSGIKTNLEKLVRKKNNLPEPEPNPYEGRYDREAIWHWMRTHKKHVALITLILVAVGSRAAWNAMMGIGVYQGYMPEQPIFFSHKIHAGQNAINCQYCHSGVEKSKVANVPSANVCMNCHKYISEGTITGKTEIAKIYSALDYNPEKQTYGPNQKPIKWIRIHNLPDHVYFNHAQHVKVGKIECTECHGEIAKMDTVKQHSPLTMGWCIDCHRKTEVKMEGNAYYDKLHEALKAKYKGQAITVAKMGGLECGKCHY